MNNNLNEQDNQKVVNNIPNPNNKKSKKFLKPILIAEATILIIILLISVFSKATNSKGKKLTCTTHHAIM